MSTISGFLPESIPDGAAKQSFYDLKAPLPKGQRYDFVSRTPVMQYTHGAFLCRS